MDYLRDPGTFIIVALATYRLSTFLRYDQFSGPWDILHKIRKIVGIRYDEYSDMTSDNVVGNIVLCMICLPIYLSVFILFLNQVPILNIVIYALGVGGFVEIIRE